MGRLSQRTPGRQKVGVGLTRGSLCAHAVCADAPASGSPYTPPPAGRGVGGVKGGAGSKHARLAKRVRGSVASSPQLGGVEQ